jgi:SAM-dependent methyltransferase
MKSNARDSFFYKFYFRLINDLPSARERSAISPILYAQYHIVSSLIKKHAYGQCIDLGCGNAPFYEEIKDNVVRYDTLDKERKIELLTFEADIEDLHIVPSETYDFALCLDVLEHVPHPWVALSEIRRILKSGAILIISVPHLSRLHEVPHDYYRFTEFGLRTLLADHGFSVILIERRGGLLSFLHHQVSLFVVMLLWPIPIIGQVALFVSRLFSFIVWKCDELLKLPLLFPAGYIVIAKRL